MASSARGRTRPLRRPGPYVPSGGFSERAPGVWLPDAYRPTVWESPTPIITTPAEAAAEYARCLASLSYFAFTHCFTLHTDDPSGVPTYRKIPMYPYLMDFFERVQTPENTHIEKSRQLLMSWAWMAVFLWDILFHDQWANLAISRKEALVDDGGETSTTDSLFGKLRLLWMGLPPYLQHPIAFRHLRVTCETTRSYVKGESSTPNAGRGATYMRALLDEAAHIMNNETVFRAVRQSAKHGVILNSTPLGKGGVFGRIRFQKRTTFAHLSYHWSVHPDRAEALYCACGWRSNALHDEPVHEQFAEHTCLQRADQESGARKPRSPWYDSATADYTEEQIASEFDLSYEKSQRGRVFGKFDAVRQTVDYHDRIGLQGDQESALAYRRRYLHAVLDPHLETVVGWDFGVSDPTSLLLGQVVNDQTMTIRWLDEFEHNNENWRYFHTFVQGLWAPIVKSVTGLELLHYGDPAGKGRDSNLESWIANLRSATPPIALIYTPKVGGVLQWLDFIHDLIGRNHFEVSLWCAHLIDTLGQYHFPLDADGQPVPGAHLPVHDTWSHAATAMSYVYMFRYHARLMRVDNQNAPIARAFRMGKGHRVGSARASDGHG